MKKMILTAALLVPFWATAAEPIEVCLEQTKNWIYRNMPTGAGEIVQLTMDFCSGGGRVTCLEPSQQWIYRNTSRTPTTASSVTLEFCKRGDEKCLEPAKQWIYRNGGGSPAEAAEKAIKMCATRMECEAPDAVRPGRPYRPYSPRLPLPIR